MVRVGAAIHVAYKRGISLAYTWFRRGSWYKRGVYIAYTWHIEVLTRNRVLKKRIRGDIKYNKRGSAEAFGAIDSVTSDVGIERLPYG